MTVVVRYRPTPGGDAALLRAGYEARLRGARLVVVRSAPDAPDEGLAASADPGSALTERITALRGAGVASQMREVDAGQDAAEVTVSTAAELHASLIVVPLERRSARGEQPVESGLLRVLGGAACPVLAVSA